MKHASTWIAGASRVLVTSLTLAATAGAATSPGLLAAAQNEVARLDTKAATAQAPTPAPAPAAQEGNHSFLSSPKGIVATVLLMGLAGYTIHSRITGAVHSPARQ